VIIVKKVEKDKIFISSFEQQTNMMIGGDGSSSGSDDSSKGDSYSGSGSNIEDELEVEDEEPQKMPAKVAPSVTVPRVQNVQNPVDNSSEEEENPYLWSRSITEEQAEAIDPYPKIQGVPPLDMLDSRFVKAKSLFSDLHFLTRQYRVLIQDDYSIYVKIIFKKCACTLVTNTQQK